MFPIRDENPRQAFPLVTLLLILANAAVFFREVQLELLDPRLQAAFVLKYALIPLQVTQGAVLPSAHYDEAIPPLLTLVTSMFLHGGLAHFVGNMWFLWIFGDNVEDVLGHVGFLIFYLVSGVLAGVFHVLLGPDAQVPTLGASGAISGVLGAYIVLFPRIRIQTLLFFGFFIQRARVPAVFFLGLWFVLQLVGGLGGAGAGIAFGAHIGGFVAGVLIILVVSRRAPAAPTYRYDPRRLRRW